MNAHLHNFTRRLTANKDPVEIRVKHNRAQLDPKVRLRWDKRVRRDRDSTYTKRQKKGQSSQKHSHLLDHLREAGSC
jgi:hypothetical protein